MLAKKTSKNQITLPKAIVRHFPGVEYFEVCEEHGCIVLKPLRLSRAEVVRAKLAVLGIAETDIAEAVAWARQRRCPFASCGPPSWRVGWRTPCEAPWPTRYTSAHEPNFPSCGDDA